MAARHLAETVRRRCRYTLPGLAVALVLACLSFTPSLLPRPAYFQGLITGSPITARPGRDPCKRTGR